MLQTLCNVQFQCRLTVKTRYSPLSIPGVILISPLVPLTLDCRHTRAEFDSFSSSPVTSHQIRFRALAVFPHLFCLSSVDWHHLPWAASLTLSVKTSSNCCHIGPALSHHSDPNEEKAERDGEKQMYVWDLLNLSIIVVMLVQYISLLPFKHILQHKS